MIVHDDLLALNYLLSRPEVDPARVAVTGASMGGSRATWIAALDDRVKVVAPVIQYTRYQNLLSQLADLTGTVSITMSPARSKWALTWKRWSPGAPRPQIVLVGDSDPLSPADGIIMINTFTYAIYATLRRSRSLHSRTSTPGLIITTRRRCSPRCWNF